MKRYLIVFAALLGTLLAPWLLQPREQKLKGRIHERLVIVSPHVESIQHEFTVGFQKYYFEKTAKNIAIDWMTPGGTSEINKYLDTEYRAAFEKYWKDTRSEPWLSAYSQSVSETKNLTPEQSKARDHFLDSNLGIQIDLFFGGGTHDFDNQKKKGYLVATDPDGKYGIAAIKKRHPDWFSDAVIPQTHKGETFYDPELCWAGTCLSAFGICYNTDVLTRLNIAKPPQQWEDLTAPHFLGKVALADPGKSGTAAKAFEMILQQEIQRAVARTEAELAKSGPPNPDIALPTIDSAVQDGWLRGMQIIQRIGANARYFTDSATKPPLDVAHGEAAAGMCIDFYGRNFVERLEQANGTSRMAYVTPEGGSVISVDPIAMFRGAPNPELATAFMEYVLSIEGQRIWAYRKGESGGPEKIALRRSPVRVDYYIIGELTKSADPKVLPYDSPTLVYQPKYTASAFNALRVIIRAMCLDTHDELRDAWEALIAANFPPRATAVFSDLRLVGQRNVVKDMAPTFSSGDKVRIARLSSDLASHFRNQYKNAAAMARRGE